MTGSGWYFAKGPCIIPAWFCQCEAMAVRKSTQPLCRLTARWPAPADFSLRVHSLFIHYSSVKRSLKLTARLSAMAVRKIVKWKLISFAIGWWSLVLVLCQSVFSVPPDSLPQSLYLTHWYCWPLSPKWILCEKKLVHLAQLYEDLFLIGFGVYTVMQLQQK